MQGKRNKEYKYDVCLSFAGEDRNYVNRVADYLIFKGIRTFYDRYEKINLWGKDLYEHLDDVYRNSARYCVIFISKNYAKKLWTNHERKSAQARAFRENKEYILPTKFDNTSLKGILETIGYINLKNVKPKELAEMIIQKLGKISPIKFLPPNLDILYKEMKNIGSKFPKIKNKRKDIIKMQAMDFFESLCRMSKEELLVLLYLLIEGCPHELPNNVHTSLDLIKRSTGFPLNKIKRLLGGLSSLGVICKRRINKKETLELGNYEQIVFQYFVLDDSDYSGEATDVAFGMIHTISSNYCYEHAIVPLSKLDFSQLSTATRKKHIH